MNEMTPTQLSKHAHQTGGRGERGPIVPSGGNRKQRQKKKRSKHRFHVGSEATPGLGVPVKQPKKAKKIG